MKYFPCYFLIVVLFVLTSCKKDTATTLNTATTLTLQECSQVLSSFNETLPISVNRFTILEGVICGGETDNVYIVYRYTTDMSTFAARRSIINSDRTNWCTNPDQKIVLESVSYVAKMYYGASGKFLGKFTFSIDDCVPT